MTGNILLVDDDPRSIQIMSRILAGSGTLRFATNGADAMRLARESPPDLVLLDAEMPGMSGVDVLKAMKIEPALANVLVIFITSRTDPEFEIAAFELGASDFISKPVTAPLVKARVNTQLQVKSMTDRLRRTAITDDLTGLPNRRHFDRSLKLEWLRARRTGEALSLLMIDVDHFKSFNDRYGHPAGDASLRRVGEALRSALLRPADIAARVGGEEFALLLPLTNRAGARHMARRVLDAVGALAIPHEASSTARFLTVSIGMASYDNASASWLDRSLDRLQPEATGACTAEDLLLAADKALYAAKRSGRAVARLLDIGDSEGSNSDSMSISVNAREGGSRGEACGLQR